MADEEKPEMTPREMIARLADMTDEEFGQFMHQHFNRICRAPDSSALMPPRTET